MNFEKAKLAFETYLKDYNLNDGKVKLKLVHTYAVVELSEYIAKDLNLREDDIELAKIIALLHDIGRFEQARRFDDFVDHKTIDHADFGAELLFKDGTIRNFIETDIYDNIIEKSIINHNKYSIENGLSEKELLHSKIIRDADKTDNFRVKSIDNLKDIANIDESVMVNQLITDDIYNDFMNHRTIISSKRITFMDMWVSYIAFIFDYNFSSGLKYIKEKNYINILVDRINYKNEETKQKMEQIRDCANEYIVERINK